MKFIKSTFHTLYQPSIPLVSINASSLLKVVDIILVNEEVRKYKDKYFYKSVFRGNENLLFYHLVLKRKIYWVRGLR